MSFFEFPHTRTYDSDLGWLIRHVKTNVEDISVLKDWAALHGEAYTDLKNKVDGLINSLVDVISPWDSSIEYPIYSIVEYQGTNYIALKNVPVGAMITNTEYWQPANTVVEQINAIGTTVSSFLSSLIYTLPEDFGAAGDGITDDTAAVIECVEDAHDNNKIVVLRGHYNITDRVPIYDDLCIIGVNDNYIKQASTDMPIFYCTSCNNVYFDGVHFIGNGTDYVNANNTSVNCAAGIYVNGNDSKSDGIIIKNCSFDSFGFSGIYIKYADNIKIKDCYFKLISSDYIDPQGNYNCGIRAIDGINHMTVEGCYFELGAIQLSVGSHPLANRTFTDIAITNNTFKNTVGQHAIYFQDGDHVVITDNKFENIYLSSVKMQVDANTKSFRDIIIANNVVDSLIDWAITLTMATGTGPVNYRMNNVKVTNNVVSKGGVNIAYVDNCICENNIIRNTHGISIYCRYSNYVGIVNNMITAAGDCAIYVLGTSDSYCKFVNVDSNTIYNCGQNTGSQLPYGLYAAYADYVTMRNNVTNSDDNKMSYGLFLLNNIVTHCSLIGNTFLNAGTASIRFQSATTIMAYLANYYINQTGLPTDYQ